MAELKCELSIKNKASGGQGGDGRLTQSMTRPFLHAIGSFIEVNFPRIWSGNLSPAEALVAPRRNVSSHLVLVRMK